MEYYISGGVEYIYGRRIFIKEEGYDGARFDAYKKAMGILDSMCVWGGHDKRYTVDPEDDPGAVWWFGWEFESNPARETLSEAVRKLQELGYVETKECPW